MLNRPRSIVIPLMLARQCQQGAVPLNGGLARGVHHLRPSYSFYVLSPFLGVDFTSDVLDANDERLNKCVTVLGEPTLLCLNFRLGLIQ
jgi:hypothetical protein